ncbi:iron-containing alcohol dehydrogenase [Parerythrobacter aestuarii]|uniref:iron-containing alcohol dehydrogenase n=1 Tax=Parerythrobacter aestuarii TaxID=3020909 RepID=UPI0024DE79A1|nr:iron-containing alcohol dehydrogenase [Parerythrobacter aestuarii]
MLPNVDLGNHRISYFWSLDREADHSWLDVDPPTDRILLISDKTVYSLHGEEIQRLLEIHAPVVSLLVEAGETEKNFTTLNRLCEEAIQAGVSRRTLVVGFGGGVVCNIAGLVANLIYRGLRVVYVPTTLLAAADVVISLKNGVNSDNGKNAFGSYLAASAIVVDAPVFSTLPEVERRSGLAELAKNALSVAPKTMSEITRLARRPQPWDNDTWLRLIELGTIAKQQVMLDDPYEQGPAVVFEYGHTVGHAIELADLEQHGSDAIRHGLAVSIGMCAAAYVAEEIGVARRGLAEDHIGFLEACGLPTRIPSSVRLDRVHELILKDNKRGRISCAADEVAMVLLEDIGKVAGSSQLPLIPVHKTVIERVLDRMSSSSRPKARAMSMES